MATADRYNDSNLAETPDVGEQYSRRGREKAVG